MVVIGLHHGRRLGMLVVLVAEAGGVVHQGGLGQLPAVSLVDETLELAPTCSRIELARRVGVVLEVEARYGMQIRLLLLVLYRMRPQLAHSGLVAVVVVHVQIEVGLRELQLTILVARQDHRTVLVVVNGGLAP